MSGINSSTAFHSTCVEIKFYAFVLNQDSSDVAELSGAPDALVDFHTARHLGARLLLRLVGFTVEPDPVRVGLRRGKISVQDVVARRRRVCVQHRRNGDEDEVIISSHIRPVPDNDVMHRQRIQAARVEATVQM